jgi:hypothetical protein
MKSRYIKGIGLLDAIKEDLEKFNEEIYIVVYIKI